jgi:hypothetical protein
VQQRHEVDVEDQITGVVRRLSKAFAASIAPDVVNVEVRRAFADWAEAPVRDFVPVLVERQVRATLGAGAVLPRAQVELPSPA